MAKRGLAKAKAGKRHELSDRGARRFSLRLRALCQAGPHDQSGRRRRGGDRRCLRRRHHQRAGQSDREIAVSLSQSAMWPDCRQRRREGRLPGRAHSCRRDPRRAARRHDLHHSGIRRPGRNGVDRAAQSALAGAGKENARRQERRALERQDHASLRAVHRHDRGFARDRGDLVAAAGLPRRQHGSAGCRTRRHPLLSGAHQGRPALCRRLPRHAGRRRVVGSGDRTTRHRHAADRRHQGLELCVAAARDGRSF